MTPDKRPDEQFRAALDGVDVTSHVGRFDVALDRLIEAKAAVEGNPNIGNCREYVAAHDAFWAMIQVAGKAA